METKETGYQIPSYPMQTKRYCQMLDLKNDPQLIAEYKKRHSPEYYWKEIGEGIRAVGPGTMDLNVIIIASIMPLVPGVAITNAVYDTLHGDYISGAARMLEAFVTAAAIAIGVGLGMLLLRPLVR